jgi:hypothetical protein
MSCNLCSPYGGSCPCCEPGYDLEPETVRCEYCLERFDEREIVEYDGARACKECAEALQEEADEILMRKFAFNPHELINCLI